MKQRVAFAGAFACAAAGAGAGAAGAAPASDRFAAEAIRICVETRADPAAVRQLAEGEKWALLDPAAVPAKTSMSMGGKKKKDRQVFTRTHAWSFEKDGLALVLGLFDIPGQPALKQCELIAWDLDFAAVDRAFKADKRFSSGWDSGLPTRNYSVAGQNMIVGYVQSDTGLKVIHLVTVNPVRLPGGTE